MRFAQRKMVYQYKYNRTLLLFSHKNRSNSTEAEKLLWFHLRNRRLQGYKFRRQYPIHNYILDFYCNDKQFAIELDGSQHMQSTLYDEKRTEQLEKLGIRLIRFWDNDVLQNIQLVLEKIAREIKENNEVDA